MDKNKYLAILVIISLIIIAVKIPPSIQEVVPIDKPNIVVTAKTNKSISNIEPDIIQTNKKPQDLSNPISIIKDYDQYNNCGLSSEKLWDDFGLINAKEALTDNEKEKLNKTLQNCEQWFARLQDLDSDELNKLKIKLGDKKNLIARFLSFKHSKDTILESRKGVKSSDYDIKYMALAYLMRFDIAFSQEIAREMNIKSISYLAHTGNIHLETLYICRHGRDCSANGLLMNELCEAEDVPCGVSYQSWLISSNEITLNLYDDLMRAVVAIENVLDSNWIEENPLNIK